MVIFSFNNDDVACFDNDAGTLKVLVMIPIILIKCATSNMIMVRIMMVMMVIMMERIIMKIRIRSG